MGNVKAAIDSNLKKCDIGTEVFNGLDLQMIAVVNLLVPNILVSIADLNIKATNGAVHPFVQPAAKEPLRRAIEERGQTLLVNSAYRTIAQQLFLFRRFKAGKLCGISAAAIPPLSNHQDGMALDIEDAAGWKPFLQKQNWQWLGAFDPMHFDFKGGNTRKDLDVIAVKAFQRLWNENNPNRRLKVDGSCGPLTIARLEESPVEGFPKVPTTIDTPEPPTKPDNTNERFLQLTNPRMQGNDVRELQQLLAKANLGLQIIVDGVFGEGTDKAVKLFQEKKGLSIDGVVGLATWKILRQPTQSV